MPNRILREGILTSPRVARLSGWADEVFYRRLMSVVDDFGRYYADTGLLRAACYPRQLNKVSDSDIGKWLTACVNAALVRVYPASDGESYLQLIDFRQQARATKSKFPEPPSECAADATQTQSTCSASAPVFVFGDGDVSEGGGGGDTRPRKRKRERPSALPCPEDVDPQVWDDWLSLRAKKRAPVTGTVVEGARQEASKAEMSLTAFLRVWCLRGSQGFEAAWLKPEERQVGRAPADSFRAADLRDAEAKVAYLTGKAPRQPNNVIDVEATDVTPRKLGQ